MNRRVDPFVEDPAGNLRWFGELWFVRRFGVVFVGLGWLVGTP